MAATQETMTAKSEPLTETIDGKECIVDVNSDKKPWLFQPGNQLGKLSKRGKQKLTTQFINDLEHEWISRGAQALQELDGKALVQACIAILPKDVLVSVDQADNARWVINAKPLSLSQWAKEHSLNLDTTRELEGKKEPPKGG